MDGDPEPERGVEDEIHVGDISDSKGVAIGAGARATVIGRVFHTVIHLAVSPWGLGVLAAVLAVGIILAARVRIEPLLHPPTPTVTPTVTPTPLAFATAAPDETMIIVTRFEDRSAGQRAGIEPSQRIYEALVGKADEQRVPVTVRLYPEQVGQAEAGELGRRYGATLVLWGWYDALGVRPVAEAIRQGGAESLWGPEIDVSAEERYVFCVRQAVPAHSAFLSFFTLGQTLFGDRGERNSDRALALFTAAIDAVGAGTDCAVQGGDQQVVTLSWAYYYRAGVYYNRGELEQALADAQEAARLDPAYVRAYRGLGSIYREMDDLVSAQSAYTTALALDLQPEDRTALHTDLGQIYARRGDYPAAQAEFERALQIDPAYARGYASLCQMYRWSDRPEEALQHCDRAAELRPGYSWVYYERGLTYQALGKMDLAAADLAASSRLDPSYAWAYYNLGIVLLRMGQVEEAGAQFDRAIERFHDPEEQANAYAYRCRAHRLAGDSTPDLADCARARELNPQIGRAHNARGVALAREGDLEEAIERFDLAIDLGVDAGDRSTAYGNRCYTYALMGDWERALADCDQAIVLDPANELAYDHRALVYSEQGDYGRAGEQLSLAIAIEPTAERYNRRGFAHLQQENYLQAVEDFGQALALEPNYAYAYSNRGFAYTRLQEYDRALTDLAQAIRLDADNAWAYYYRGITYSELDRAAEAIADLEQALIADGPPLDETRQADAAQRLEALCAGGGKE